MFRSLFPILTVSDVERSLGFYRDLLDGRVVYRYPEDDDAQSVYVSLALAGSSLGIGLDAEAGAEATTEPGAEPASAARHHSTLWLYVDDCDRALARLASAGAPVVEPAADQPWGERVARVHDPDGNVVVLAQAAADSVDADEEPEGPTGLS